jgi:predicted Ser/Thr protein kinase
METCAGCGRSGSDARCAFCGVARAPGGYKVERVLAQGPHGRVYRACGQGEAVALKELQFASVPGAQEIDAFEREAAMLQTLRHARIPRFVASFSEGEGVQLRLYLASQFIEGELLSARIARGPFTQEELRDLAVQVLEVLVYLHRQPVLHRDIKPDNLIVRPGGEIVLVDFGSARRLLGSSTYGSTMVGTFGYMPTEQLGGTVDATSDLYALGATLLHASTGKPPADLLASDFTLQVPRTVPEPIRAVIERLVQPRRERRFQSAEDVLAAIAHPRPARLVRRRIALFALAAGAVTAASFAAVPARVPPRMSARLSIAESWFAVAKPSCNPVEVARFMSGRTTAPGWDGAGYAAGCWALAGKIDEARAALSRVAPEERWRAAGIVFDLAHPVADAGDDVAAAPIMNLVLESWPNHFQALYHAGMSDYALGNRDRARTHLAEFLRLYSIEDGFRRNARDVLARLP